MKMFGLHGRSDRLTYLFFNLFPLAAMLVWALAYGALDTLAGGVEGNTLFEQIIGGGFILTLLLTLWISLAVTVRRLHDIGGSGWWLILVLIIPFGGLLLLFWPGNDNENKYGPSP